jgi:hypothetical protein
MDHSLPIRWFLPTYRHIAEHNENGSIIANSKFILILKIFMSIPENNYTGEQMKKFIVASLIVSLIMISTTRTSTASSIDVGFQQITFNMPYSIGNQLHLNILDETSAQSNYGITLSSDQVLFIFTNDDLSSNKWTVS